MSNDYKIFPIEKWEEAKKLGKGAGWCVADTHRYFQDYVQVGKLFYVHKKTGGKWRPYLCVHKTNKNYEIAKRGNKHIRYFDVIIDNRDLKPWLKDIGVTDTWPDSAKRKLKYVHSQDQTYIALYNENGIEIEGNGYTRQPVEFSMAGGGTAHNINVVSFEVVGGDFGKVSYYAIYKGNILIVGPNKLNIARTLRDGDTFEFSDGCISATLEDINDSCVDQLISDLCLA